MRKIITIILLFVCIGLQSQTKWETVIENKRNSQMIAQIDKNSIKYNDKGFLLFTSKTIYQGLTRKQYILRIEPILKRRYKDISLKDFSYTVEDVIYSTTNNRYKVSLTIYYDDKGNILHTDENSNMLAKDWFTPDKGSIIEKVINHAIENVDL